MDFGIAKTGFARGSPPGTTTEVPRVGLPFAEIRFVSQGEGASACQRARRKGRFIGARDGFLRGHDSSRGGFWTRTAALYGGAGSAGRSGPV
jgi:hypothetical protein